MPMVLWKSGKGGSDTRTVEVRLPGSGRLYAMTSGEPRFVEKEDLGPLSDALMAEFPEGSVATPAALQ